MATSALSHTLTSRFSQSGTAMAELSLKNIIFFPQIRPSPSVNTTRVSVSTKSSTPFQVLNSESAIATTSPKLPLNDKNTQARDYVLDFFKSHGFDDTLVEELIRKYPIICPVYVDQNLKPKFEYLIEYGFSGADLYRLLPSIMKRNLTHQLIPSLDILSKILVTTDRVRKVATGHKWLLTGSYNQPLQRNFDIMLKQGVAGDDIADFIMAKPTSFLARPERMIDAIKLVKDDLGMSPGDGKRFMYCVGTKASMGHSLWDKKVSVLRSFGWSHTDIWSLFKRFPTCFTNAEHRLTNSLDFYTNVVKLNTDALIDNPILLQYSIGRRVRPRYDVLQLLLSEKLLPQDIKFNKIFVLTEDKFLGTYVTRHLERIPGLLEMYQNAKQTTS